MSCGGVVHEDVPGSWIQSWTCGAAAVHLGCASGHGCVGNECWSYSRDHRITPGRRNGSEGLEADLPSSSRRTTWTVPSASKRWTSPTSTSSLARADTRCVPLLRLPFLPSMLTPPGKICRFCWHHIKENLNGRCPACRAPYDDTTVEFKAIKPDECVVPPPPYLSVLTSRLGQTQKIAGCQEVT